MPTQPSRKERKAAAKLRVRGMTRILLEVFKVAMLQAIDNDADDPVEVGIKALIDDLTLSMNQHPQEKHMWAQAGELAAQLAGRAIGETAKEIMKEENSCSST